MAGSFAVVVFVGIEFTGGCAPRFRPRGFLCGKYLSYTGGPPSLREATSRGPCPVGGTPFQGIAKGAMGKRQRNAFKNGSKAVGKKQRAGLKSAASPTSNTNGSCPEGLPILHWQRRWKKLSSVPAKVATAVTVVMTICGVLQMYQRPSVSVPSAVDSGSILSVPFEVTNSGPLPLFALDYTCSAPAINAGFQMKNVSGAFMGRRKGVLLPAQRTTADCRNFIVGMRGARSAQVRVSLGYYYALWPWRVNATYDFTGFFDSTGKLLSWMPQ